MQKKIFFAGLLLVVIGVSLGSLFTVVFQSSNGKPLQRLDADYEHVVQAQFVAVDEQGNGVVSDLETEVRQGQGLVLVNVNNVLADVTTQYSARLASIVASNYTHIDTSNLDIIYNLKSEAGVVAGQSAGSIMAVSAIAALQGKDLRADVIITGSISADGAVVNAGGLRAKAAAAKEGDATLFLVPKGSGSSVVNMTRVERCTTYNGQDYCSVTYPGQLVSIGEDIGITVIEVETVAEAMEYFL
ncbi:MAG: S16 family serine protease [Candidatus Woesearchaeota archaeon]|nr:S16 family serine protease [Candidatus Woesearchaeota archaeon]